MVDCDFLSRHFHGPRLMYDPGGILIFGWWKAKTHSYRGVRYSILYRRQTREFAMTVEWHRRRKRHLTIGIKPPDLPEYLLAACLAASLDPTP